MINWRHGACDDPGPCPVDDTPHTACTSDDVVSLTQPLRPSQTLTIRVSPPFTTGDYRRAVHGPAARQVPSAPARVDPPPTTARSAAEFQTAVRAARTTKTKKRR